MEYPKVINFNYNDYKIRILKHECRSKKYCEYSIDLEKLNLDRLYRTKEYLDFQNKLQDFLHSQGFNCSFSEDNFYDCSYQYILGLDLKLSFSKRYLKKLEAVNV